MIDQLSLQRLAGVHTDLQRWFLVLAWEYSQQEPDRFLRVTEGVRSKMRQAVLLREGATRTMDSAHITGDAVDLAIMVRGEAGFVPTWELEEYRDLNAIGQHVWNVLGSPGLLEWGGTWPTLRDGVHWQRVRN